MHGFVCFGSVQSWYIHFVIVVPQYFWRISAPFTASKKQQKTAMKTMNKIEKTAVERIFNDSDGVNAFRIGFLIVRFRFLFWLVFIRHDKWNRTERIVESLFLKYLCGPRAINHSRFSQKFELCCLYFSCSFGCFLFIL